MELSSITGFDLLQDERLDDLVRGGLKIIQSPSAFCFSMDAVLLANFVSVKKGDKIVDLGTGTGVNIRTNHFRFEYGLARKVTFQSLFFFQNSLRRSGQFPNFFVPVGDFAPTTYRVQQQLVFAF